MKVINKSRHSSSSPDRLFLEVQSTKALIHDPRVMKLLEVTDTMETLCLVTECTVGTRSPTGPCLHERAAALGADSARQCPLCSTITRRVLSTGT